MGVEPQSGVIDDKDVKVQYGIISTKLTASFLSSGLPNQQQLARTPP
jgi:hypothetical protein